MSFHRQLVSLHKLVSKRWTLSCLLPNTTKEDKQPLQHSFRISGTLIHLLGKHNEQQHTATARSTPASGGTSVGHVLYTGVKLGAGRNAKSKIDSQKSP